MIKIDVMIVSENFNICPMLIFKKNQNNYADFGYFIILLKCKSFVLLRK